MTSKLGKKEACMTTEIKIGVKLEVLVLNITDFKLFSLFGLTNVGNMKQMLTNFVTQNSIKFYSLIAFFD